jgi:hypothetical protein
MDHFTSEIDEAIPKLQCLPDSFTEEDFESLVASLDEAIHD